MKPPSNPKTIPKQDTPFDPFRFRIQPISMEERRELIALELPSLDPKYLEDTKPPNGGLAAPEKPEAPPQRGERNRAVLSVVGLVSLVVVGAAILWPLASEPVVSPASTAVATPSDAEVAGVHEAPPIRSPVPKRIEAPTAAPRAPEVSVKAPVKSAAPVAVTPQLPRKVTPAQRAAAAATDSSSAATTQPVVGTQSGPALPKSWSAAASASAPTSVSNPRRIDQLLYQ